MKQAPEQRRRFFRHPINVPIKLKLLPDEKNYSSATKNISLGGLCFHWPKELPKGSKVSIEIPIGEKNFDLNARIVYTKESREHSDFSIGVVFTDFPSSFKARLAEEILRIMEFRNKLRRELGSDLSEEEAAERWIAEYARKFPHLS